MDNLQLLRRAVIREFIHKEMVGLEIGPYMRPTILPGEIAVMEYADYYSTEELKCQAVEIGVNPDLVSPVTHVIKDTALSNLTGHRFDIIIANHVLEHLIDPFEWLRDMEALLNEGGIVVVTLPDKKYSFDRFRPDTSLAHFVTDFVQGGKRSLSEHCLEACLFYDYGVGGKSNTETNRLQRGILEGSLDSYHPGMHVHVFQAETFKDNVLIPFLNLGYINYECVNYVNNPSVGEFTFLLRKTPVTPKPNVYARYENHYDFVGGRGG